MTEPFLLPLHLLASMLPAEALPLHELPGVELVPFSPLALDALPAPLGAVIFDVRAAPLRVLVRACLSTRLVSVPRLVVGEAEGLEGLADALGADDAIALDGPLPPSFSRRLRMLLELGRTRATLAVLAQALDRGVTGFSLVDATTDACPLVYVTGGFERVTGYPREEVVGRNCRFLAVEGSGNAERARVREAMAARATTRVVLRNARRDGRHFWNDLSVFPITLQGVTTHFYGGIQHDVTEQIDALHEEERLAEERVGRLTLQQDELRRIERLAAMGTMVAGFAHEVRNPVASLRAMTEQLDEDLSEIGQRMPHFARMLEALARIERLVDTSLQFGRPASARRTEHPPWELLSAAMNALAPRARALGGEIRVEMELGLPSIFVDHGQLVQVLVILLNNALDSVGAPGRVLLRAVSSPISNDREGKRSSVPPGGVRFEVSDDGPGISPDVLGRVFDPFFTTKPTGTGLGLSIAQQLVAESSARLEVLSTPGVQTTFTVVCAPASFYW